MLELALTTRRCVKVLKMLARDHRLTAARVAKIIGQPIDYVDRIGAGKQSFQVADLEAVAKHLALPLYRLIFDSIDRAKLKPHSRKLYDMGAEQIAQHEEPQRVLSRKLRRSRSKPTAA